MASRLPVAAVIPSIHDVRGALIPGLAGTRLRPLPPPGGVQEILQAVRPGAPGRSTPAGGRDALATTTRSAARAAGVDRALSIAVARAGSPLDPRARQQRRASGSGAVSRPSRSWRASGGPPTRFADVRPFLPASTQGYVPRVVAYATDGTGAPRA